MSRDFRPETAEPHPHIGVSPKNQKKHRPDKHRAGKQQNGRIKDTILSDDMVDLSIRGLQAGLTIKLSGLLKPVPEESD